MISSMDYIDRDLTQHLKETGVFPEALTIVKSLAGSFQCDEEVDCAARALLANIITNEPCEIGQRTNDRLLLQQNN